MARHRLMRAAKALREKGIVPPGVDTEHQKVRSCATLLPREQHYKEGAREGLKRRLGEPQVTV
jgi:hypothetical protein